MPGATSDHSLRRLHLGCGSVVVDGWTNIDNSPGVVLSRVPGLRPALRRLGILTAQQTHAEFPAGIVRTDLRRGIPAEDGSVSAIYSSHLIEHLSRWQGLALLRECFRALAPGGVVRIATPDLAELVRRYVARDAEAELTPADTLMERMMTFHEVPGPWAQRLIRRLVTAPHQWLYDEESLIVLFREAGFASAERRAFRTGDLPDLELIEHRDDGLIVEARR